MNDDEDEPQSGTSIGLAGGDVPYTSTPWTTRSAKEPDNTGGLDRAILDNDNKVIAECFEHVGFGPTSVGYEKRPVQAIALLMAAAPEMLLALQDILPRLTGHAPSDWREAMRDQLSHPEQPYHNLAAAIAKALGTEPANMD